jgi:hypothetical protein
MNKAARRAYLNKLMKKNGNVYHFDYTKLNQLANLFFERLFCALYVDETTLGFINRITGDVFLYMSGAWKVYKYFMKIAYSILCQREVCLKLPLWNCRKYKDIAIMTNLDDLRSLFHTIHLNTSNTSFIRHFHQCVSTFRDVGVEIPPYQEIVARISNHFFLNTRKLESTNTQGHMFQGHHLFNYFGPRALQILQTNADRFSCCFSKKIKGDNGFLVDIQQDLAIPHQTPDRLNLNRINKSKKDQVSDDIINSLALVSHLEG